MAEDSDDATLSVQIANQFINIANNRMQEGINPAAIAAALRHAAANYTAFVEATLGPDNANATGGEVGPGAADDIDPTPYLEEFVNMFQYYLERHQPAAPAPGAGLQGIIRQVEEES